MALALEHRNAIVGDYQTHDKDTGSPDVQIALLTENIRDLTGHLKQHKHDHSSRRGLLQMVSRRNRLLRYLQRTERERYLALIQRLGLRK